MLPLFAIQVFAQSDYQLQIYNAYLTSDLEKWKQVLTDMEDEQAPSVRNRTNLLNAYYGYIGKCIDLGQLESAKTAEKKAQELCNNLIDEKGETGLLLAYRSALLAYRAHIDPIEMPFLGPQSISDAEKALNLIPENPLIHYMWGNIKYYAPEVAGGSKPEAIENYEKALSLMDEQLEMWDHNWLYPGLLKALHLAYQDNNQPKKAAQIGRILDNLD